MRKMWFAWPPIHEFRDIKRGQTVVYVGKAPPMNGFAGMMTEIFGMMFWTHFQFHFARSFESPFRRFCFATVSPLVTNVMGVIITAGKSREQGLYAVPGRSTNICRSVAIGEPPESIDFAPLKISENAQWF